jgi:hypothetical protein
MQGYFLPIAKTRVKKSAQIGPWIDVLIERSEILELDLPAVFGYPRL